ncbi:MAG: hypothetical protein II802_00370 [Clostridia bacterium]|nr:hypothetical protein [Clostridia bacterium]
MNNLLKKYTSALKSPKILIIIGLCGIFLIGISSVVPKSKKSEVTQNSKSITTEEYREYLEQGVIKTVSRITGNDNVTVMITLESGIRYAYADTTEGISQNKTGNDSESFSSEEKQSYVTVKDSDGGERALLITEKMPEVRGIAIVCDGGDNEEIAEKIKNAVMAALNITSKRICVAGGTGYEKR